MDELKEISYCKNCNAELKGNFCHECGQNSKFDAISFKLLLKHFLDQIFGIESRLVVTLKACILNPAKLTKDYLAGKHRSYVSPINMYLLSSTILALFLSYFPMNLDAVVDQMNAFTSETLNNQIKPEVREKQIELMRLAMDNFRFMNIIVYFSLPFFLRLFFSKKKYAYTLVEDTIFVLYITSATNFFSVIINIIQGPFDTMILSFLFMPLAFAYVVYMGTEFYKSTLGTIVKMSVAYILMYLTMFILSAVFVAVYMLSSR